MTNQMGFQWDAIIGRQQCVKAIHGGGGGWNGARFSWFPAGPQREEGSSRFNGFKELEKIHPPPTLPSLMRLGPTKADFTHRFQGSVLLLVITVARDRFVAVSLANRRPPSQFFNIRSSFKSNPIACCWGERLLTDSCSLPHVNFFVARYSFLPALQLYRVFYSLSLTSTRVVYH